MPIFSLTLGAIAVTNEIQHKIRNFYFLEDRTAVLTFDEFVDCNHRYNIPKDISLLQQNNFIHYSNSEGLFVYNARSNEFRRMCNEPGSHFWIINENEFIQGIRSNDSKSIRKSANGSIQWTYSYKASLINYLDSRFAVFRHEFKTKTFSLFSLDSGEIVWTFKLADDYTSSQKPKIINGNLIIFSERIESGIKQYMIIAVDLESGIESWKTNSENMHFYPNLNAEVLYSFGTKSNVSKLISINPKDGKSSQTVINSETVEIIQPFEWFCQITDDYLLFTRNGIRKSIGFGLLNLSTKKIVANVDLDLEDGVKIKKVGLNLGKAYILTTVSELHVFDLSEKLHLT